MDPFIECTIDAYLEDLGVAEAHYDAMTAGPERVAARDRIDRLKSRIDMLAGGWSEEPEPSLSLLRDEHRQRAA